VKENAAVKNHHGKIQILGLSGFWDARYGVRHCNSSARISSIVPTFICESANIWEGGNLFRCIIITSAVNTHV
jgi:hypothetical protein